MPIRAFLSLSRTFTQGFDQDAPNPFLTKRVVQEYDGLGTRDRLRIHGIIDREDYIYRPPYVFRAAAEPDIAQALDMTYEIIMRGNREDILLELNKRRISSSEPYAKLKLYGCIPVYIAIDLAHAIESPVITPYQAKIGPV